MKRVLIGTFLAVVLILWRFYFNAPPTDPNIIEGTARQMPYTIKFDHPLNDDEKKKASSIVNNAFLMVDSLYSEVAKLNKLSAYAAVPITEELERLFLLADRVHFLTNGLFDPTIPSALKRWQETLKLHDATPEDIELIKSSVGWSNIHFRGRVFYKEHTQDQIDIDQIITGFMIDILAQNLQEGGFSDVLLTWGHVSKSKNAVVKAKSPTTRWKVQDCGKSGTFCHIMNPLEWTFIKQNQDAVCFVTVELSSAALAQGIADALLLLPKSEAEKLADKIKTELNEGTFQILSCAF